MTLQLRRAVLIFIILGLILLAVVWAYDRFLAPEDHVVIRTRATNAAHRAIMNLNYSQALDAIELGIYEITDADWELLTWQAVLLERLDQPSQAVLVQALEAGSFEDVWITYGTVAALVNEPLLTLTAGEQLTERDPNSVQGNYLLAQGYDELGQIEDALTYYTHTLQKIDEIGGNEAVYIAVRQRVVQLNLELLQDEITCCD